MRPRRTRRRIARDGIDADFLRLCRAQEATAFSSVEAPPFDQGMK